MIVNEVANMLVNHMTLVNSGAYGDTAAPATDDPKNSPAYILDMLSGGFAHWAGVIARSPLKGDLWSFCKTSAPILVGADGFVQLSEDDVAVTGSVLGAEVSYDTGASPPVAGYRFATEDAWDAIYRRVQLASIFKAPLYSYALVGEKLITPALGVKLLYLPSALVGTDPFNAMHLFPVMAETLSMLYGQKGGRLDAAGYYSNKAAGYAQLALTGKVDFLPLAQYPGP